MNTTAIFLIAMAIIFTAPWLIWRLGRTDYFAPLVVIQIITGIPASYTHLTLPPRGLVLISVAL